MMRSYRLLFVAAILGLCLGCGATTTKNADSSSSSPAGPPKAEPRGETNINAGDMDYARQRDFPFTIANTGGEPLKLTLLAKSCGCAEIDVPSSIAPGAEGKIVIHWSPIPGACGPEALSAVVGTNDPKTKALEFRVTANIRPLVHVFVEGRENNPGGEFSLDFTVPPVSPTKPGSRELTVFSTKVASFQVNAACSVPGFEVSPPTALPAGSRVGTYENVASGYKFEVRSTKDVPIGYSRGVVNLNLSKLGEGEPDRTLAIPLVAMSSGGGFTIKPDLLEFKKPKLSDPDTASVVLTVFNPAAKEEVTVESHEPSFLKVDAPEKAGPGRWKITVHLPENNAEAAKYQVNPPMIGHVKLKVAGLDRPVNIEVKWDPPSK